MLKNFPKLHSEAYLLNLNIPIICRPRSIEVSHLCFYTFHPRLSSNIIPDSIPGLLSKASSQFHCSYYHSSNLRSSTVSTLVQNQLAVPISKIYTSRGAIICDDIWYRRTLPAFIEDNIHTHTSIKIQVFIRDAIQVPIPDYSPRCNFSYFAISHLVFITVKASYTFRAVIPILTRSLKTHNPPPNSWLRHWLICIIV